VLKKLAHIIYGLIFFKRVAQPRAKKRARTIVKKKREQSFKGKVKREEKF
jgi:hypothetical protein